MDEVVKLCLLKLAWYIKIRYRNTWLSDYLISVRPALCCGQYLAMLVISDT